MLEAAPGLMGGIGDLARLVRGGIWLFLKFLRGSLSDRTFFRWTAVSVYNKRWMLLAGVVEV